MYFETFQKCCKHRCPGFDRDHQLIDTCRHKENTPPGSSWGMCDIRCCPMVRAELSDPMTRGDVIRSLDNETMAIFLAQLMDEAATQTIKIANLPPADKVDARRKLCQNIENLKKHLDAPAAWHLPI